MKPTHRLLPAALTAAFLAAGNASAGVIYDNGGPNQSANQLADTTFFFTEAADEFSLVAGGTTIGDVHWWGGCAVNDGGTLTTGTDCPSPGAFTLSFYNDSGSNSPGTLIMSYDVERKPDTDGADNRCTRRNSRVFLLGDNSRPDTYGGYRILAGHKQYDDDRLRVGLGIS